jgi:hypothetical protein
MFSHEYRIGHASSKSVAILIFSWEDGEVKVSSLNFICGNVLDLQVYKKYKQHALTKFLMAEASMASEGVK